MFPWLPFLTFPDSSRRKRRLQVYLPTQNESNSILCSVEVFTKIPDKEIEIHLAPTPTRLSNRSISSSPVPSTSSKSPRSGSGLASSRPPSARDKKPLFAPPIEPKPSRNQRKGLETSSAMLELFGGTQPLIQITSSKEEEKEKIKKPEEPLKEIINVEAKENIEQNLPTKSTEIEQPSQQISDVYKSTGITACFETISHPDLSNKNYARKNVLERETFVPSEWETIKTHPSTSSTFQTIEDHDLKYAETSRRGNWQTSTSHFNVINQTNDQNDKLAQPGPENFDEEDNEEICPAEKLLKSGQSIRCNLHEGEIESTENEAIVFEEFILDDTNRRRRNGQNENNDHKDTYDQMQLSNPGPELNIDDEEEDESEGVNKEELFDGQKVAMDAAVEKEYSIKKAAADNNMQKPNAGESIEETAGIRAESMKNGCEDDVFESSATTRITSPSSPNSIQTAVGAAGGDNSGNYNINQNNNSNSESGVNGNGNGVSGENNSEENNMVSLTTGGNGGNAGAKQASGGGGEKPILIKGAQIVNDDSIFAADILIEDGTIKQVSQSLTAPENAEVIEATGKLVLPAGIDVHTEFSTPGSIDDFSTGTRAALAGGTTTIIDVVLPRPEDTLLSAFDRTRQQAQQKAVCNFGFSIVITKWSEATKKEMELLVREKGVNSFILDLFSDSDLYAAFEHSKLLGAHVRILPENRELASLFEKKVLKAGVTGPEGFAQSRPSQLEADRIQHVSIISQFTNCPLSILSVTSSEASKAIHHGRRDGTLIQAEVPIAAIIGPSQNSSLLTKIPLRYGTQHTNDALEMLANGSLSMCVSDHCTPAPTAGNNFTRMNKGAAGVEERMMALWEKTVANGRIDPMRFVAVTSANAAKSFNLYPKKGRIAVGADADVIIWDIKSTKRLSAKSHVSKAESSLFENLNVRAFPVATICGGKILYKDGKHVGAAPGMGAFLALKPNSPFIFSVVHLRENMNNFSIDNTSMPTPSSSSHPPQQQQQQHQQLNSHREEDKTNTGLNRNKNVQQEQPSSKPRTKVIHPPGGKSSGLW